MAKLAEKVILVKPYSEANKWLMFDQLVWMWVRIPLPALYFDGMKLFNVEVDQLFVSLMQQ